MTNRTRTTCGHFVCKVVLIVCAALIAIAFAVEARADTFLNVNVAAYHYDRNVVAERRLNEQNWGLGLEFTQSNSGILVGEYRNSMFGPSVYALARYSPLVFKQFSAGVVAGGVTGYKNAVVSPVVGLVFTVQGKRAGVSVILTPSIPEEEVFGFAGLQLRFKL